MSSTGSIDEKIAEEILPSMLDVQFFLFHSMPLYEINSIRVKGAY